MSTQDLKTSVSEGVKKTKRFMVRLILLLLLLLIVGSALYIYLMGYISYSDGTRTGYLVKISEKGYLFKTFEGEMNLGGIQNDPALPGIIQNTKWEFSAANRNVYNELQANEGKRVKLHYQQVTKSFPWQGDTPYFVDKVEKAQ